MLDLPFRDFFRTVVHGVGAPYPYQERLAFGPWPDLVDVPTGLGKTAAITAAWLYKRLHLDPKTPRRLLWCLPMRVLVEQTQDNIEQWLENARPYFEDRDLALPRSYALMGGETVSDWVERPEEPAVLIGTQDMLLSRALMRGYATSRYRWPLDFALVHNDALWVFDEVQLMGPALATSAQLEAFRRNPEMVPAKPSRSIWLSATLRSEWLSTVDFRSYLAKAEVLRLSEEERGIEPIRRRREAVKEVRRVEVRLDSLKKADLEIYAEGLAETVYREHTGDSPTLVVLNSVDRAQQLKVALDEIVQAADGATEVLLVHARFRQADRERLNRRIRELRSDEDVIIVATQAIEAGVDLTSERLFTELAPWSSLVQRLGRCNRGGEYAAATVYWINIDTSTDPKLALPYDSDQLDAARRTLANLTSAAPADLPPVTEEHPLGHVIRRKDFVELFNTEPDLSGHDIDISPYLRDAGQPQLQVFWRDFEEAPGEQPKPVRAELCPVSIGQLREHLGRETRAFIWDPLSRRWTGVTGAEVRPGQTVLLSCQTGGYHAELGFLPRLSAKKHPVSDLAPAGELPDAYTDDSETQTGCFVKLAAHSLAAETEAEALCETLAEDADRVTVISAALWHDIGKSHPASQTAYRDFEDDSTASSDTLWAKTPGTGRLRYRVEGGGGIVERKHFRHELASMLAWLEHGPNTRDRDLVAYLIAAHHGKVRLGLRALPGEQIPPDGRRFARGVWEGDVLPAMDLNGLSVPETILRLDLMEIGDGAMGPSWLTRTRRLLREVGPFRLAWLEALVRIADWRASARGRGAVARQGSAEVEI